MSKAKSHHTKTHCLNLAVVAVGIAALLMSSGCSFMQGVAGAAMGPEASAASGAGGQKDAVETTYQSFEYSDCKEARNALNFCSVTFMEKAGLVKEGQYLDSSVKIYNPRDHEEDWDERWIPGWDQLPTGIGYRKAKPVYAALATAAIRKNWAQKCTASYTKAHKEQLAPADAEITAKIEAARELSNSHARIGALTKLRGQFESQPRGAIERRANYVGGRYQLEKAIAEELRAADLEVLYHKDYLGIDEDLAAKLRPRMSLEDETDAYCQQAALRGTDGLPAVDAKRGSEVVAKAYPEAKRKAIDAKLVELNKTSSEVLALSDEAMERLDAVERGSIGSVHSVEQNDDKLVVIDSRTENESVVLGCKDLDKVKRVHADGRVEYEKECRYADRKRVITKRYQMPQMPEDADIAEGNSMSFYYIQTEQHHEAKKGDSSPKADDVYETYERQVLFVTELGENSYFHN